MYLDWSIMRPPYDPNQGPVVEGEQLWLRQRRLRINPSSEEPGEVPCVCGRTSDRNSTPHTIDSAKLFAGRKEVQIVHQGETYRLLVTRNNKLILQK